MINPQDLYSFLSDARLTDLMERVKVSDNFLDVVALSETQHSGMLAWCLHPNEGHGQGDAVVKDFLIAAYNAGAATNRFSNKIFFEKWTPGRVRTSSFGSAFIATEFSLRTDDVSKRRRLDLFVIDPVNKLVITIENKAGARLNEAQLGAYYERVSSQIARRPVFQDYDFAYVVVDTELNEYSEDYLAELGNKWALLDYSWLAASANRARRHMERNNEAAQLLMAYCEKQTGWQSPNEKHISELAAELASQYEALVEEMRSVRKIQPTEWRPTSFDGAAGELLLFIQQNRQLCDHLVQARGIGSVLIGLRKALPSVAHDDFEHGRTWLWFSTEGMQSLAAGADDYLPIYVNIFREASSDDENSKFTVRLIWTNELFQDPSCDVDALREHMASAFPGLRRFGGRSVRRIVAGSKLNATAAVNKAAELADEVDALIKSARQTGILS